MDDAASAQASTRSGAAWRQVGAALGRMAGRAAIQAGKALLRWAVVTIGPWVVLLLLALAGLVLVLALLHGPGGQQQVADVSAARAAVRANVRVRSFDSEELQFLPSPTLVAVIAWNLSLQHRSETANQVSAALRPTFRYAQVPDETDEWLKSAEPGAEPVLVARVGGMADVVIHATTYQGTATLTYTATPHSVACPQGADPATYCTQTGPLLTGVSWTWDDSRYLAVLQGWFPGQAAADTAKMLAFEAERWDGTDVASLGMPLPPAKGLIANVQRWDPIFTTHATPAVPVALLEAVTAQESGGDPGLTSPAGAEGLMQVEPGPFGLRGANLYHPNANVAAGSAFLQWLAGQYGLHPGCVADRASDPDCQRALTLVLAAYNAGPGAVAQWGGVPPYKETIAYVRDVEGYLADFAGGG